MSAIYWPDAYQAKKCTAAQAISHIKRGKRVFVGTSCGEPQTLVKEMARQSCNFTDVEVVRVLSLETAPLTLIADETACRNLNIRSFYLGSAKPRVLSASKRFLTPINLSEVPRLFQSRQMPIHVALIQVSEPDDFGWVSLGVSVDVTMAAARSADLVIAQVNPAMPRVMGRSFLHVNDIDLVVEAHEPLLDRGQPPGVRVGQAHRPARSPHHRGRLHPADEPGSHPPGPRCWPSRTKTTWGCTPSSSPTPSSTW